MVQKQMKNIIARASLFIRSRRFRLFFMELPLVFIFVFVHLPFVSGYVAPSFGAYIFMFLVFYFWIDSARLVYLVCLLLLFLIAIFTLVGNWFLAEKIGDYLIFSMAILLLKNSLTVKKHIL